MNNNTGTYGAALDTTNLAISALLEQVGQLHTGDAVELINELDLDDQVALFRAVSTDQAVLLLDQPELHYAEQIIDSLDTAHAGEILNGMSADRATDIFHDMDWPSRNRLFAILSAETKANLKKLMGYPTDTAGGLMTTEFISVPTTWTVEQTLAHIRQVERSRETVYAIYVEDPATRILKYVVSLRRLIIADPKASIAEVGRDQTPLTVPPLMDQEEVSRLFRKHDLLAIPVVDEQHHLLGIVTVDDVLDAMTEETSEDAYKFGGMEAFTKPYMQIGFFEMLRKRGGWLCILFLSEMLTASAMQHFEVELEKAIVLALFIPLIMSSGGNSGSQATSLLIRALALQDLKLGDWWRVALREIPTGLALGSMLGLIGFVRIAIWQKTGLYDYGEHWVLIGITIGVALIGIVLFGSVSGSMLPFILQRLGLDPASASAPFVATLVDVMGLIIYFSVAVIFLTGTLL